MYGEIQQSRFGAAQRPLDRRLGDLNSKFASSESAAIYLKQIYRSLDQQPQIDEFDRVPLSERTKDKAFEAKLEKEYRFGGTEEGTVLERFLVTELGRGDWLGGETFATTKFDDFHGIDAVIEWDEQEKYGFFPRLAIDFTTSVLPERVSQKRLKNVSGGNVKYFKSPFEMDESGESRQLHLQALPTIVLGIDGNFLPLLATTANQHERKRTAQEMNSRDRATKIDAKTFAHHPLQLLLLEQAMTQMGLVLKSTTGLLVGIEAHLKDPFARSALDGVKDRLRSGRTEPQEIIEAVRRAMPALHEFAEARWNDLSVLSLARGVSKWENIAAINELLGQKRAELDQNKNTAQFMAARAWREASITNKLLTRA